MRILHAIHDFLPKHRAGSEIYAARLASELGRSHDVRVLCAEYDLAAEHGSIRWRRVDDLPVAELINNWRFRAFEETYASAEIDRALAGVLDAVRPDVVHVHSLLNLSFNLPRLARATGAVVVATLHDYSLVCPSGGQRFHVADEHVCHAIDPERCARCFSQSPWQAQMAYGAMTQTLGARLLPLARRAARAWPRAARAAASSPVGSPAVTAAAIEARLAALAEVYEHVALFVAPSAALANDMIARGLPAARVRVSDYGFAPLPRAPRQGSAELRIGFVGTLVWHKGAHRLLEEARRLPAEGVRILLHGDPATFPAYSDRLRALAAGLRVELPGPFDDAGRAAAYASMDVLVVPSLWPENSPLVIHEAFQAGVAVVAARVGGIPELVEDGVSGLLFDPRAEGELAACLERLRAEPGLGQSLAAAAPPVKSIEEDARGWIDTYDQLRHEAAGR